MPIEFQCPNGHKLSCGEDRAGRTVKCPKCGAVTQIPALSSVAAGASRGGMPGEPAAGDSAKSGRDSAEVAAGSGIGSNMITFYCPNGHKLSGPIKLQGRTGQCPHCNEKFRIPTVEETTPAQTPGHEVWEAAPDSQFSVGSLTDSAFAPPSQADSTPGEEVPTAEAAGAAPAYEYYEMPDEAHPLCRLFDKLWEEKAHGAIVELHIRDAGTLVPDWFERRLSLESHGLFAVQAADGTLTLTAVAWDSINRVVVRNVVALPEGMFE